MKKITLILFACALMLSGACTHTGDPQMQNYTVPSWTLYQRALHSGQSAEEAKTVLVPKERPYNINTTIHGDPATQMGVSWFTNASVTGGVVQIAEGTAAKAKLFAKAREIPAVCIAVDTINYVSIGRGEVNNSKALIESTGFAAGEKRSYTSNKALIDQLKPNTTYSYRVGNKGAWSATGTFTTAKGNKDAFEFIYITDTQANTDAHFDLSKKTVEAARQRVPEAQFLLITGDHVESAGAQSSEWEWEQWFERMQHLWLHLPIVPAQGNHDTSPFSNLFHHFNTDNSYNLQQTSDDAKTAIGGTVYSFVYGDALFMVINYEDFRKGESYFAALETWMRQQTTIYSDARWRIGAFHKTMFTGSNGHQAGADGRIARARMSPLCQELNIDFVMQGHDHVYEVIGVMFVEKTKNGIAYTHLPHAVSNQQLVAPTFTDGTVNSKPTPDVTGKRGGAYDVSNGALYFLNNSAGTKKYYPRSNEQMEAAFPQHGVKDYFGFFNKFGQTGEPTFSRIKVATDAIDVATYTISDNGEIALFDAFRIVKE
jgi:hypothetical protein